MTRKYPCPHHEEKTPSAVAYANSYFSFCCGRSGPLSELGLSPSDRVQITYVEDIRTSIDRIKTLPKQEIRGFQLHADDRGYYLIWPDSNYYKRRVYGADASNKYRGPSGHTKPPFVAQEGDSDHLVLIEGEFNALTFALLESRSVVVSPGGAGDFYSKNGTRHLGDYARYGRVDIVVDSDAAGAQAAIETKAKLLTLGCPDVRIHLMAGKDLNDIFVENGKEALRDECKRMGL